MKNSSTDNQNISVDDWPPATCVAAFVFEALTKYGYQPDKKDLVFTLKTKSPLGAPNEWNLPTTSDFNESGVSLNEALKNIPLILDSHHTELEFTHLPLTNIPFGLFTETLKYCISNDCVTGIGFDASLIYKNSSLNKLRHVSTVINFDSNKNTILMLDRVNSLNRTVEVSWSKIESAIRSINDGFWIIGKYNIVDKLRTSFYVKEII